MSIIILRDLPPTVDVTGLDLEYFIQTITALLVLVLLAIALRIWARLLRGTRVYLEDVLIYIATVVHIIHATLGYLQTLHGGVIPEGESLDPLYIDFYYKMLIATNVTYGIVVTLSKCSILVLYHRIFSFPKIRLAVKIAIIFNIMWGILAALSIWVACRPVSWAWDKTDPNGTCEDALIMTLTVGVLDVVGDLVIFIIPIPVIKHIQVSKTEKRLLYGLFGVGAISTGASCVRMVMTMTDSTSLDTEDLTWMILWTQIVPAMSIIITCGMLLRPILQKILPKTSRRSGDTTARRYNIIDGTDQSYTRREWTQDSDLAKPSAAYALREREALPDR